MSALLAIDATVEDSLHLRLDKPLEFPAGTKARLVFLPEQLVMDDITEAQWLCFASQSGAFDDLKDPREDIYTLEDGEPFMP
jgi:hypothetical protein